jgi:oxalate decarboxylase
MTSTDDRNTTPPEPMRPGKGGNESDGATVLGPRNRPREAQGPNVVRPPRTDKGTLPNMRWAFADSHISIYPGGWTRQTTVRELPISTEIAGVNMRLNAGGVRELHWHKASEWAYVIAGEARITSVDQQGRTFQDDVREGDLWYFPSGIPHSIQGIGEVGVEFLLVFDDGNFSEDNTFLLTDMCAHLPPEVLAKNFGWTEEQVSPFPKEQLYIFQSEVPGPLTGDQLRGDGPVPNWFKFQMMGMSPQRFPGGTVRIVDSRNFPASVHMAAALVELEPGAMREIHWHPNTDEWQYYLSGQGRMTVFASSNTSRTFDVQAGDVGTVPFAMGHYVENTGTKTLRFLELFASDHYADVSLTQWLALTPHGLVAAHLNVDQSLIGTLPTEKHSVMPGRVNR